MRLACVGPRSRAVLLLAAIGLLAWLPAARAADRTLAALSVRYEQLRPALAHNPFDAPIHVQSETRDGALGADVYGLIARPFAQVSATLAAAKHWCDFIPLHLNVKACVYGENAGGRDWLTFYVGRKFYQTPGDAYALHYRFRVLEHAAGYLHLRMDAADGPVGTSDYVVELEAMPVGERTLVKIHVAYQPSLSSRLATNVYLSTLGRDKVGFSRPADSHEAQFVKGVRGVTERNAMRYYLALQSLLETDPKAGFEVRAAHWFDLTEHYRRQLHELDRAEYLSAKRREHANQLRLQRAQLLRVSN